MWTNFDKYKGMNLISEINLNSLNIYENLEIVKTKKTCYYNIPCAFDIETTSFIDSDGNKNALMYEWTFGINGHVIYGREWNQFIYLLDFLNDKLTLSEDLRLIVYVHNLSFEFQFMKNLLQWDKIFALKIRKPLYAISKNIEFKCSYLLSGYSLEKLAEQLTKYKINKLVGFLDYKLYRHPKTPLREKELQYNENDVRVVMSYIQEKIEQDGGIHKIPLTKTGYVRNYCRKHALYGNGKHKKNEKYHEYRKLISSLTLEEDEYKLLKRVFSGGFTHANYFHVNKILDDIGSFDFISSYPAVMCLEKFPMSKGKKVNINSKEEFTTYLKKYCCMFDVYFENVEAKTTYEHSLSASKTWKAVNMFEDNGRVITADSLYTSMTEIDFQIFRNFYNYSKLSISNMWIYEKQYLPKDLILSILYLYANKTKLKNVVGKEIEYLNSKENANSAFGMMVTDICRDIISYETEWNTEKGNVAEDLKKYNKDKKRFLHYPWGVWTPQYSKRNLFTGIIEFKDDYVYSDTDSVKGKNYENHMEYINKYNNLILKKINDVVDYYDLDINLFKPKNIKGEEKILGIWEFEGAYEKFKTLGAKRYLTFKDNKYELTVSGLNKKTAIKYIHDNKLYPFDFFKDDMYIPSKYVNDDEEEYNPSGKNCHTYIDENTKGILYDYNNVPYNYNTYGGVYLEAADYTLKLSDKFIDYLKGVKENEK